MRIPFIYRRNQFLLLHCLALFFTLSFWGTNFAEANTTVSASLNTEQFSLNEVAVLTIVVEGSRSSDIHVPKVKNLGFHQRGESTQMQMINGTVSISVSSRYLIRHLNREITPFPP